MVRRKSKAREAPIMSKTLSGRMENGLGEGALKLGGGDIDADNFTLNTPPLLPLFDDTGQNAGAAV